MKKTQIIFLVAVFLTISTLVSFALDANKNVVPTSAAAAYNTPMPTPTVTPTKPVSPTQVVQQPIENDSDSINVNIAPAVINNEVKVEVVSTPTAVVNNYVTNVTNVTNVTCNCTKGCNSSQSSTEGVGAPGPVPSPTPAPAMVEPVLDGTYIQESTGLIILWIKNDKSALDWSMYLHMTTSTSAEDLRIDLGKIATIVSEVADGGVYGHATTKYLSDYPSGTILNFWVTYYVKYGNMTRETGPSNMVQVKIP